MDPIRILTWNLQADQQTTHRREQIVRTLTHFDADILCLTEAFAYDIPDHEQRAEQILISELSDWAHEKRGARKVMLWSRWGWSDVDTLGSANLAPGRFISATTRLPSGEKLHVIGVCIPWHSYRTTSRWQERQKQTWQGNSDYLNALREDVLTRPTFRHSTIIAGDFNLQIPPKGYPGRSNPINETRARTFADYRIPTSEIDSEACDFERIIEVAKPPLDHIAHTPDLQPKLLHIFTRFLSDGKQMTDHNGVMLTLEG